MWVPGGVLADAQDNILTKHELYGCARYARNTSDDIVSAMTDNLTTFLVYRRNPTPGRGMS